MVPRAMDPSVQKRYRELYDQMFDAVQGGNRELADKFRVKMEFVRQTHISKIRIEEEELSLLPSFVRLTLDKTQCDLKIFEASNCINAAFNYHRATPLWSPHSTMDFLNEIRSNFIQLNERSELALGDLIVFWSRDGEEWRERKIMVENLDPDTPGFPFGLVFDHVAVYVGDDRLFHKPDPTKESPYQINSYEDIVCFNEVLPGFELTFHRKK